MVDDAQSNLDVYERTFRQIRNAKCIKFTSSAEGLQWATSHDPDLVLVDYDMPAPNGLEFIQAFRGFRGKGITPVVMITASKEAGVRHAALELGATDFLTKPADPLEFVARARNLLALRDRQKELAGRTEWLATEVRRATAAIVERERETIFQLLQIAEFRDSDTASHIVRIGHLAALLGNAIGLSSAECELLRLAAPMHDIGKVSTPDNILLKRGKLTQEEWVVMRKHTVAGYEILKDSRSTLLRRGAEIALTHHEKWDGSGYPNGAKGEEISLSGRITALVDVADALTSVRPYKAAWPMSQALEQIRRDRGKHFDPKLVDAFLGIIPEVNAVKVKYADVGTALAG